MSAAYSKPKENHKISSQPLWPTSNAIFNHVIISRTKRVGDANTDAQQELNRFLKEFNERFRMEEDQRKRDNEELIRAQDNVEAELVEIQADYEQNKRQVLKMLLDQILLVNIEVPKVVQQKFE